MGHSSSAAQAFNSTHPGISFPNVAAFLPFYKAERNKELPEWLIKGQLRQHCTVRFVAREGGSAGSVGWILLSVVAVHWSFSKAVVQRFLPRSAL